MMRIEWLNQSHNIVDIVHGVIPYNGLEAKIIEQPIFARLQRVLQSSLAYITYPSNKVHRYEHSMGVMHLSGMFFFHSISNSKDNDIQHLFDDIYKEIDDWVSSGNVKYLKSTTIADFRDNKGTSLRPNERKEVAYLDNTLYRSYTPANLEINQLFLYYSTYEAVRLVGLLHDIGHLPYSHITEFAMKRLYDEIVSMDNVNKNNKMEEFVSIMRTYCDADSSDNQIHEKVGQKLVRKIFETISDTRPKNTTKENIFLATVFYMTERILTSKPGENTIFSDIHRIVDGVIDCDRMDYCCRDLYCAGVSKEFPRYERLFYTVKLYYNTPILDKVAEEEKPIRERCNFSFNSKALGQIEMLLQRRWEDFTTINYHHSVHKHELLLELAIADLGKDFLISDEISDEVVGLLPFEINSIWKVIKAVGEDGAVDILASQLDDEWLNTLLKHQFYKIYGGTYESRSKNHNDVKWNRLDELITGQRHYCSLFKRTGGFGRLDDAFYSEYKKEFGDSLDKKENEYFFDVIFKRIGKDGTINKNELIKCIGDAIKHKIDKGDFAVNVIDCIIDGNDFSLGIKAKDMESIYIVSSQEGNAPVPLKGRSSIRENLEMQKRLFPPFHIYYLPEYNSEHDEYQDVNKDALQEEIARIMVEVLRHMTKEKN